MLCWVFRRYLYETTDRTQWSQTNITLSSKVIAITGANRGIGLGIVESCLVNDAARVYSLDIGDTADEFHGLSQRFPGKLFAIHTDVTQESSIATAVDKIIDEADVLHGMVVNAGRTKHKPGLEFTDEEIEALFSVNLFGSFYSQDGCPSLYPTRN